MVRAEAKHVRPPLSLSLLDVTFLQSLPFLPPQTPFLEASQPKDSVWPAPLGLTIAWATVSPEAG